MQKVLEYQTRFLKYAYLWANDKEARLRYFLAYSEMPAELSMEEVEKLDLADIEADANRSLNPPTLVQFKEQIDKYEEIYAEVNDFISVIFCTQSS